MDKSVSDSTCHQNRMGRDATAIKSTPAVITPARCSAGREGTTGKGIPDSGAPHNVIPKKRRNVGTKMGSRQTGHIISRKCCLQLELFGPPVLIPASPLIIEGKRSV